MSAASRRDREMTDRAQRAIDKIAFTIDYDEDSGTSEGEKDVAHGLDAVASVLVELANLAPDLDGEPLDRILAEMGEDKQRVEAAAELIERIGRSSYTGLSREDAEAAEELRGALCEDLVVILAARGVKVKW